MDGRETRATLWVAGVGGKGTVVVPAYPVSGGDLAVEVIGTDSKVKAHVEGNRLVFTVSLECRAVLVQEPSGPDAAVRVSLEDVERRLESVLAADIAAAFRKTQSLRVDPFGLGFTVSARQPELWERYKDVWPDAFASAEVRVSVKADIVRAGFMLENPR
jgi:hypothetical protein